MLISQGSSSINLTFVIEERQLNEAVTRLHASFFETENVNQQTAVAMVS
jgi:aspartokinase